MTTNLSAQQLTKRLLTEIAITDQMLQELHRVMAEYKSRNTPFDFRGGNAEAHS